MKEIDNFLSQDKTEIYFTFLSTHAVIRAEKALLAAGFSIKVRPIPSAIKAGCGICLCVSPHQKEQIKSTLVDAGIQYAEIYKHINSSFQKLDD